MDTPSTGWSRLTSSQLLILVEVKRTGSLARAASSLDVSAPAVSQQVARIEKTVGAALVERGPRGATLTPLGLRLAEHGARVFEELQLAEHAAADYLVTHATRLRIGSVPSVSASLLPPVLATLRYRHPGAELSIADLSSETSAQLVADDRLDVAFTASYLDVPPEIAWDDGLRSELILREPLVVVLPHDHRLAGVPPGSPIDIGELAEDEWVGAAAGHPARTQLEECAARAGFVPRVSFRTDSYDVAQSLADVGVAIALVPHSALSDRLAVNARPLASPPYREIRAVTPRRTDHIPLVQHLLTGLRQVAADQRQDLGADR